MTSPMPIEEEYGAWREDALDLIERVAKEGVEFDAYTLESVYGLRPPPNPSSHWGRLFGTAADHGIIEPLLLRRSSRPASKGSFRAVWCGTEAYRRVPA